MKTCTLFNIPVEVARETILTMKDLVIKAIKNDDYEKVDDLIWSLRSMQQAYENALKEVDSNE